MSAAADALDGFVAFGIGPIVTYSTKLGKSHLDLSARWSHDFDVSKRVEGEGFNFSTRLSFEVEIPAQTVRSSHHCANKTRVDSFPHRLSEWDLGPMSNHAVISDISMRDEFS